MAAKGKGKTNGTSTPTCNVCGGEVTSKDPEKYPFCRNCHYTGQAAEQLRADQIERFEKAFPDAQFVGVEHTGGGCFWLAIRYADSPKFFVLTDGEAGLPDWQPEGDDDVWAPLPDGGWGYVGRHDDTDPTAVDDWDSLSKQEQEERWDTLGEDYEGTALWWYAEADEAKGIDYDASARLSDEQAIEIVKRERARLLAEAKADEPTLPEHGEDPEFEWEVTLPNGDKAGAEDLDGALLAARTLMAEAVDDGHGRNSLRDGLHVYRHGQRDNDATAQARRIV